MNIVKQYLRKRRRLRSLRRRCREEDECRRNAPKPYAYRTGRINPWHKIVVTEPPYIPRGIQSDYLIGPFRSEVDCEEFCDRENSTLCRNVVKFYSPQPVPKKLLD